MLFCFDEIDGQPIKLFLTRTGQYSAKKARSYSFMYSDIRLFTLLQGQMIKVNSFDVFNKSTHFLLNDYYLIILKLFMNCIFEH